jgi:hypothetical protein
MSGAGSEVLPAREILNQRLEDQRRRAWQAQGICSTVAMALDGATSPVSGMVSANAAGDAAQALQAACAIISEVTGALEPDVLLSAVLSLGEEAESEAETEEVQP